MGSYVPSTQAERQEMLHAVGVNTLDELYGAVPKEMMIDTLHIPSGKSELEVSSILQEMAGENRVFSSIFRGAGAYHHYIPSIVKSVTGKEEFITAYTPYQAEISQGILQSIFEYQTMICELTGMDVSNASVYDGASAAAEAVAMCKDRKRQKALVSQSANPMVIQTIQTYCEGANTELVLIPAKDGKTDLDALKAQLDDTVSGVYFAQPSFFGVIEDAKTICDMAHEAGAKAIMGVNPIACAMLPTPGECGADIAVGEGQPLGLPLSFGGPYLGFMAATSAMMRKLPGRIVGQTTDIEGKRAFVLTLQAREQHIRREKASSNICSNQAHCALTAGAYMAAMGGHGLQQVAGQCYAKAHYACEKITAISGFDRVYEGDFFHEFVTTCPTDPQELMEHLEQHGILGPLPIEGGLLWCVTEMNSKAQIDALAACLEEVGR